MRRRRLCAACSHRFTTFERVEEVPLVVVKSDGSTQLFDREKVIGGLRAAAKGRDVGDEQLIEVAVGVEDEIRLAGGGEVSSSRIGRAVLERLRQLDEVTYLRFASVYKNFDAASDFQSELELLSKPGSGT